MLVQVEGNVNNSGHIPQMSQPNISPNLLCYGLVSMKNSAQRMCVPANLAHKMIFHMCSNSCAMWLPTHSFDPLITWLHLPLNFHEPLITSLYFPFQMTCGIFLSFFTFYMWGYLFPHFSLDLGKSGFWRFIIYFLLFKVCFYIKLGRRDPIFTTHTFYNFSRHHLL